MNGYAGVAGKLAFAGLMAVALAACTLDDMQRSDRIRSGAGDAVAANLESETVNPMSGAMFDTRGLGANGAVVKASSGASTTGAPSGTGGSATP